MVRILLIAILLSGCTAYTPTKLPLPAEPNYPTLTKQEAKEFNKLPKTIRQKLILRDKLKNEHIKELSDIIRATH